MANKEVQQRVTTVEKASNFLSTMVREIEESLKTQSPEEVIASMALPIFEAADFHAMFEAINGVNPRDELMDVGLHIETVSFNRSTFEQGLPFYANFQGIILEGANKDKDFATNCGGWQPVVVAYNLWKKNWLPKDMLFHKADKPTAQGYYPVNLLPWGHNEEAF